MLISNTGSYAIRACNFLAQQEPGEFVSIKFISDDLGISYHYLAKIFQKLSNEGLTDSLKGPHGGVRLRTNPDRISLLDITLATDFHFSEDVKTIKNKEAASLPERPLMDYLRIKTMDVIVMFEKTSLQTFINHRTENKTTVKDYDKHRI